jgi:hypothetical protein
VAAVAVAAVAAAISQLHCLLLRSVGHWSSIFLLRLNPDLGRLDLDLGRLDLDTWVSIPVDVSQLAICLLCVAYWASEMQ